MVVLMVTAPSAQAAFPGDNGKIAYVSGIEIHTMDPDGTNQTNLLGDNPYEDFPTWSPDGARIAFIGDVNLMTMNADGTGRTFAPDSGESYDYSPAWSPDGTKLLVDVYVFATWEEPPYEYWDVEVFDFNANSRYGSPLGAFDTSSSPAWSPNGSKIAVNGIATVNPDGNVRTPLTSGSDWDPDWSPDGSKIVFYRYQAGVSEIYVVNANGTGLTQLTNNSVSDYSPVWSPDGSKIAFTSNEDGDTEIFVMGADGSNRTQLTNNSGQDYSPDWQPLLRGYPRPKGATPTRVPLVPVFAPCTSPNSTHGAPLSFSSCNPPEPASASVFVGGNDGILPAKSIGSVVLKTLGIMGPPDDADVRIEARITNVMNTSDRSDYTGELRLELPLRITDRFNAPHPNVTGPGTVADTSFFATVPCAATADPTLGAACTLSSTTDAILPGTAREGGRAVWALGQVKLHDGGPDADAETAGDNGLLAVQGLFIP